ncbi:hypothetical protein ACRHQN_27605 [Burkholderia pseudomallei]|uniref:hypothetical protein n=1 Tax=Burkholderia pseudomallei TaxID=28450 RepID=UPI0040647B47
MKKVSRKQSTKHKKFISATSHMYEGLFGEDPNDTCLTENSPKAKHLSSELPSNNVITPVARNFANARATQQFR